MIGNTFNIWTTRLQQQAATGQKSKFDVYWMRNSFKKHQILQPKMCLFVMY